MKEIRLKARAKINISLDVIKKRDDGYHDLSMIMQTINLYDKVNLKKIKKNDIIIKTNLPFLPVNERNLVYKVIQYMREIYNIESGVFVDLYKVIPVAAGLAGGSSDAAATIKGMNKLFNLKLSFDEMLTIGGKFGADIPYCMIGGTALAEGIGDKITCLNPFPKCYIVIAKPTYSMSTASVYGNLKLNQIINRPNNKLIISAINNKDLNQISNNLCNVLETVTIAEYPHINLIKRKLIEKGALGALMSGSGPSVYGLFNNKVSAHNAMKYLKQGSIVKYAYVTTIYNRKRDK